MNKIKEFNFKLTNAFFDYELGGYEVNDENSNNILSDLTDCLDKHEGKKVKITVEVEEMKAYIKLKMPWIPIINKLVPEKVHGNIEANPAGLTCFITEDEATQILYWLSKVKKPTKDINELKAYLQSVGNNVWDW